MPFSATPQGDQTSSRPPEIHVFETDSNGTLVRADVGTIRNATNVQLSRNVNGADEFSFQLPRQDAQRPELQFNSFLKVYDAQRNEYRAAGYVSGKLPLSNAEFVSIQCRGLLSKLADVRFPEGYILNGNLHTLYEKFGQEYLSKRITAKTAGTQTPNGKDVLTWEGDTSQMGLDRRKANITNGVVWEAHDTADEGSSGILSNDSVNGEYEDGIPKPPFGVFISFWGPTLDFDSAVKFDTLKGTFNVPLSSGGQYPQTTASVYTSGFLQTNYTQTTLFNTQSNTYWDAVGIDLSDVPERRFIYVFFSIQLAASGPIETLVEWRSYEVIARRDVPGITTGTWTDYSISIEERSVGGQTQLAALNAICKEHDLEMRADEDGEIQLQKILSVNDLDNYTPDHWGADKTDEYTLYEGAHVNILDYTLDDADLCNRATFIGPGAVNDATMIEVFDRSSIRDYGPRHRIIRTDQTTYDSIYQEAQDYIDEYSEPASHMTVEVLNTPSGEFDIEPGDAIRIRSKLRDGFDGGDFDGAFRITREMRTWNAAGETIKLELEGRRTRFTRSGIGDLTERVGDVEQQAESSISGVETGVYETNTINDNLAHTFRIPLSFEPYNAQADMTHVYDTTTSAWYDAYESPVRVDVLSVRRGPRHAVVTIARRSSGTQNSFRARFRWTASGSDRFTRRRS